jgi:NADH dehydrogenase
LPNSNWATRSLTSNAAPRTALSSSWEPATPEPRPAANLQAFTDRALHRFLNLRPQHLRWVLVDVAPRILPELGARLGSEALTMLRHRGMDVRLGTSVSKVSEDRVVLSDGQALPCRTLVWTAGVTANPLMATLGLPAGPTGRLVVTPELQLPGRPEVFAAGDAAAVPDLTKPDEAVTPPTAQHAQRQGVTLARNVVRSLRGEATRPYRHRDLGLVVDLGGTRSVARPLGRNLSGLPAQVVTRGYHLTALPSLRARAKAATSWLAHASLGDDFVRVGPLEHGRGTLGDLDARTDYLPPETISDLAQVLPPTPS